MFHRIWNKNLKVLHVNVRPLRGLVSILEDLQLHPVCTNNTKSISQKSSHLQPSAASWPAAGSSLYLFSPLRQETSNRLRSRLTLTASFLTWRKSSSFAQRYKINVYLRRSSTVIIFLLSCAWRNATAHRDWRCVICRLKAVYIKAMSLRRVAIRRSLPFLRRFGESQTERLLGRRLKCLSGRNLIGLGKATLLTRDVRRCFSVGLQ